MYNEQVVDNSYCNPGSKPKDWVSCSLNDKAPLCQWNNGYCTAPTWLNVILDDKYCPVKDINQGHGENEGEDDSQEYDVDVDYRTDRYFYTNWSDCSTPCSGGTQTRNCIDSKTDTVTDLNNCIGISTRNCNRDKCHWGFVSNELVCLSPAGMEVSSVYCPLHLTPHMPSGLPMFASLPVNPESPYAWQTGSWTECSKPCNGGLRTREAFCVMRENGIQVDSLNCDIDLKPVLESDCNRRSCIWMDYSGGGTQKCWSSYQQAVVDIKYCLIHGIGNSAISYSKIGGHENVYAWIVSSWGSCESKESCGEGFQNRSVFCIDSDDKIVKTDYCINSGVAKPSTSKVCTADESPGFSWYCMSDDFNNGCYYRDHISPKTLHHIADCEVIDKEIKSKKSLVAAVSTWCNEPHGKFDKLQGGCKCNPGYKGTNCQTHHENHFLIPGDDWVVKAGSNLTIRWQNPMPIGAMLVLLPGPLNHDNSSVLGTVGNGSTSYTWTIPASLSGDYWILLQTLDNYTMLTELFSVQRQSFGITEERIKPCESNHNGVFITGILNVSINDRFISFLSKYLETELSMLLNSSLDVVSVCLDRIVSTKEGYEFSVYVLTNNDTNAVVNALHSDHLKSGVISGYVKDVVVLQVHSNSSDTSATDTLWVLLIIGFGIFGLTAAGYGVWRYRNPYSRKEPGLALADSIQLNSTPIPQLYETKELHSIDLNSSLSRGSQHDRLEFSGLPYAFISVEENSSVPLFQ